MAINPYCSFCGKSKDETKVLIQGPSVYICGECIDLCNEIVSEKSKLGEIEELDKSAAQLYRFLYRAAGGLFTYGVFCSNELLQKQLALQPAQLKKAIKLLIDHQMIKTAPYGRMGSLYLIEGSSAEIKFDEHNKVYSVKANVLMDPNLKEQLIP